MITVTGGAGFIGSGLVWALNRRGITDIIIPEEVSRINRLKENNLAGLQFAGIMDNYEFLQKYERGELKTDCIFHMGACSTTTETDREYIMMTNYEYTRRLAASAVQRGSRLIYASSAATYGDGSRGFSDNHSELEELEPMNMYGESKHLLDLWIKENSLLDSVVGLKYFNVYGPNEYHKGDMSSFALKAFGQVKDTGKLCLFKSENIDYPDGGQKRDFIYLKEAVDITMFFYDNPDIFGIFNAGTGIARTWKDLAGAVFSAMNTEPAIDYIELPDKLKSQYQYYTKADMSKLHNAGYDKPGYSLEYGVSDYLNNYLKSRSNLSSC